MAVQNVLHSSTSVSCVYIMESVQRCLFRFFSSLSVSSGMIRREHEVGETDDQKRVDGEPQPENSTRLRKRIICYLTYLHHPSERSPTSIYVPAAPVKPSRALFEQIFHSKPSDIYDGEDSPKRSKMSGGFRQVFAVTRLHWSTLFHSGRLQVLEKGSYGYT